jgi:hypothetical protein
MAMDSRPTPGTRARAEGASNAMSYMIGAVVIAALAAVVMMFAFRDETPSGSTATSPGTNAPVTQPQPSSPPNRNTTTPAQPSTK